MRYCMGSMWRSQRLTLSSLESPPHLARQSQWPGEENQLRSVKMLVQLFCGDFTGVLYDGSGNGVRRRLYFTAFHLDPVT